MANDHKRTTPKNTNQVDGRRQHVMMCAFHIFWPLPSTHTHISFLMNIAKHAMTRLWRAMINMDPRWGCLSKLASSSCRLHCYICADDAAAICMNECIHTSTTLSSVCIGTVERLSGPQRASNTTSGSRFMWATSSRPHSILLVANNPSMCSTDLCRFYYSASEMCALGSCVSGLALVKLDSSVQTTGELRAQVLFGLTIYTRDGARFTYDYVRGAVTAI